jgi:uncharacterized glyoxalase superfamily protein PhnB
VSARFISTKRPREAQDVASNARLCVIGRNRDDDGNVVHAELVFRGSVVMLSTAGVGREPFRSLPAGGRLVYCALDEVDSLYQRVREAGGDIALTDTDDGSRDFTVRDPEGNLWAFGTYRPRVGEG